MDSNVEYEIDNDWEDEVFTDDDAYIEEVDNREWIDSLIRDINLDQVLFDGYLITIGD